MRKIYLLEQSVNTGYDVYDSMIIIAEDIEEAILLSYERACMLISEEALECNGTNNYNIAEFLDKPFKEFIAVERPRYSGWALRKDIQVTELGYADLEIKESYVVCSSFNAG